MTIIKARKILDEICDNISGDAKDWIRSIDKLEKKVASLDAIIESMEEAEENETFQLVSQLPSIGKTGVYYIVLNSTSNKYEEYKWNGTSFDKVGLIGDEVYPELVLTTQFYYVEPSTAGYEDANPSTEGWYAEDPSTHEYSVSQDEHTYSSMNYSAVDDTAAGYSEKIPSTEGWYESDGQDGYVLSQDNAVEGGKTYYTGTKVFTKDYFVREDDYKLVSSSTAGYAGMNPKHLDWFERNGETGDFFPSVDTSVQGAKQYFVPVS